MSIKRIKLSEVVYWAMFPIKTLYIVALTEYEFWKSVKAHTIDKPFKDVNLQVEKMGAAFYLGRGAPIPLPLAQLFVEVLKSI